VALPPLFQPDPRSASPLLRTALREDTRVNAGPKPTPSGPTATGAAAFVRDYYAAVNKPAIYRQLKVGASGFSVGLRVVIRRSRGMIPGCVTPSCTGMDA
jgi:hypothetical protein